MTERKQTKSVTANCATHTDQLVALQQEILQSVRVPAETLTVFLSKLGLKLLRKFFVLFFGVVKILLFKCVCVCVVVCQDVKM